MNWIEYRIKEARDKGLPELDLGLEWWLNRNTDCLDVLTELPKDILSLTHLTKLNLSGHALKELPPEISQLKNLKALSIDHNSNLVFSKELSRLSSLTHLDLTGIGSLDSIDFAQLPNLQVLDISYNHLESVPAGVFNLKGLTELALQGNRLREFPRQLHRLLKLHSLSIGNDEMQYASGDLARFSQQARLKALSLYAVQSSEILEEISQLVGLEHLAILWSNPPMIPAGWFQLSNLSSLEIYCSDVLNPAPKLHEISNLRDIRLLTNLKKLKLGRVSSVGLLSALVELRGLTSLEFWHIDLGKFPAEILTLGQLELLTLSDGNIGHLPEAICSLQRLRRLNLSRNPLTSLPEEIASLQELTELWLSSSALTAVPQSLKKLRNLKRLSLRRTKLDHWPQEILELSDLEELDLSETGVSEIPKSIARLQHLTVLSLEKNQIQEIPDDVMSLPLLKQLDVSENPITNPPPEIVARGTAAIQGYFSALRESETTKLFEAKLIIVGEGEVGKTCLAYKLVNPNFDIEANQDTIATTHGIEIKNWHIATALTDDFKVNIWDFGGQEIYHATHQFFLTKRSLYLFVWDARKEDRLGGFDYWLNVVRLLSNNSPLLIVLNKADIRIKEIDQGGLKARFDHIASFHKVSALTGQGIAELTRVIKMTITTLPHVGDAWPAPWSRVRQILEDDERNYIDYEEYLTICRDAGLDRSRADLLSTYLHDLGVILHFQDDPLLQKIVILKPEWGTNAVYAVLDTKKVQENNGRFSSKDLEQIWGHTTYPPEKHAELRQLMVRFELCFQLGNSPYFIAPELLSLTPPHFVWDGNDTLQFEYHYNFMPAGIMTRFIARNHELMEDDSYWRNGAVLAWEGSRALVVSDPLSRKIRVAVMGKDKKDLLAIVRRELAFIHKTLNNPDVRQMIPCICDECRHGEPFLFEYQRVRRHFEGGLREIVCDQSLKRVSIEGLLTGVFTAAEVEAAKVADPRIIYAQNYYERGGGDMPARKQEQSATSNPWSSGSFYLVALFVVIGSLATVGGVLSYWALPVIIVGALLLLSVLGALQLKQDARLSEAGFLKLMALTLRQLPLLGKSTKTPAGNGQK